MYKVEIMYIKHIRLHDNMHSFNAILSVSNIAGCVVVDGVGDKPTQPAIIPFAY